MLIQMGPMWSARYSKSQERGLVLKLWSSQLSGLFCCTFQNSQVWNVPEKWSVTVKGSLGIRTS